MVACGCFSLDCQTIQSQRYIKKTEKQNDHSSPTTLPQSIIIITGIFIFKEWAEVLTIIQTSYVKFPKLDSTSTGHDMKMQG